MNTQTNSDAAAATGLDHNTSPARVAASAGAHANGQSGSADRAPATALPTDIVASVRTLKGMAVCFGFDARKARKAAERRHHEHNMRACRRHAAALIVASRRGFVSYDAYREACRLQREGRAA